MDRMNRVFLSDGVLAAGPDSGPIVQVMAADAGNTPVLADDPTYYRLAVSLANPLSAGLLPRPLVMEPPGHPHLGHDTYQKPDAWGEIHNWEVMAAGYSATEDARWSAISLFYSDPDAAQADAGELVGRMNGYRTAVTPLMFPNMTEEGLAACAEGPYVINEFCTTLTPVYASDETGSVLTVWWRMYEPPSNRWHTMLDMRDLGFLLP
jgi:hypothetical protein